ncbi:MAG: ParB/RepB/Spo0J family partition protein [Shewanella sp.]
MALGNLRGLSELVSVAKGEKNGATGKQILSVPVDQVVSKVQVRKRFRFIEELAVSLVNEGQQSPIIVYPRDEEGRYVIQKGERRWRACKQAGLKTIDIIINDKQISELDEIAGELIENIQRDDLTPFEIANALNAFFESGLRHQEIADRVGKSRMFVINHLSLLKAPDMVRQLYVDEITQDIDTLNNLRQIAELDETFCWQVCANAAANGITRAQSRSLLKELKNPASADSGQRVQTDSDSRDTDSTDTHNRAGSDGTGDTTNNAAVSANGRNAAAVTDQVQRKTRKDHSSSTRDQENPDAHDGQGSLPYKKARLNNIQFVVHVLHGSGDDAEVFDGEIMTDRVAHDPSQVWIRVLVGLEERHICVPLSEVELVSIDV